ncbi:MAG: AbrB/MazE/SpoVT family DNA-binding domain-containing protein [Candidatus Woesearchaeota archaeon]
MIQAQESEKDIYLLTPLTSKIDGGDKMALVEIRTITITEKGQIAIPRSIRETKGFNGSKVAILAFDDRIELRPMKQISESMLTALASEKVLSKEWLNKKEDEAWKHL